MGKTAMSRPVNRILIGLFVGAFVIPALGIVGAHIVAHHEISTLSTTHSDVMSGFCQGQPWRFLIDPSSPCRALNDAVSIQYLSWGIAGFALGSPFLLILLGYLLYRRPLTLGFGFPVLVMIKYVAATLVFASEAGLLVLICYFGVNVFGDYSLSLDGLLPFVILIGLFSGGILVATVRMTVNWGQCNVFGIPVSDRDAPQLWRTIRRVARDVKVKPPDHLVIGRSFTFFVTRAQVQTPRRGLIGTTLYLPSVATRLLSDDEFRSCIGHEMAHLRRGLSPAVIALAATWPSWQAEKMKNNRRQHHGLAALCIPGMAVVSLTSYFLSKLAAKGFPAFESAADRLGIVAGDRESLIVSLIKQTFVQSTELPIESSRDITDTEKRRIQERFLKDTNHSLLFATDLREILATRTDRGLREWLERVEEKYPSPFHPLLAARAKALAVDINHAFKRTVAEAASSTPSFIDEIVPAEEQLTSIEKAPPKDHEESEEVISARERVMANTD